MPMQVGIAIFIERSERFGGTDIACKDQTRVLVASNFIGISLLIMNIPHNYEFFSAVGLDKTFNQNIRIVIRDHPTYN